MTKTTSAYNSISAAERQRRRRQRRREGEMVVQVTVSRQARDVLMDARWLGEWDENDRTAVENTVQRLLDGILPVTRDGSG